MLGVGVQVFSVGDDRTTPGLVCYDQPGQVLLFVERKTGQVVMAVRLLETVGLQLGDMAVLVCNDCVVNQGLTHAVGYVDSGQPPTFVNEPFGGLLGVTNRRGDLSSYIVGKRFVIGGIGGIFLRLPIRPKYIPRRIIDE